MWFSDFQLVLPDQVIHRGALRVQGGIIREIRDRPVARAWLTGHGRTLMPGFIDLHGDMIEREVAPRPNADLPVPFGIFELDKKLACAGVTTAFAALAFSKEYLYGHARSLQMTRSIIDTLHNLKARLLIDHHVHARYEITSPEVAPVLLELLRQGRIALLSLMDHTPGQGQYRNLDHYVRDLAHNQTLSHHAARQVVADKIAQRHANTQVTPALTDLAAQALRHGLPLASHDDDSPAKVTHNQTLGISISEFPVTLEAARTARRLGMWTLMGAPNALRDRSTSGNLRAREAANAGLLSMLATDYHPPTLLMGALSLIDGEPARLPEAAALLSLHAAHAAHLTDRGAIAIGKRADLVVIEPGLMPRLLATFSSGRLVYSNGALLPRGSSSPVD